MQRVCLVIFLGCFFLVARSQETQSFIPKENDTLYTLIDYNPLYTEDNTKGYQHDFMNLNGPCLTSSIYDHADNSFVVNTYGVKESYVKELGRYYSKRSVDGKNLYGSTSRIHIDYKDSFRDRGPFDFKALQTLVSDVEIRMAYGDMSEEQKEAIGACVELLIEGRHTVRILPKGKHELMLPGIVALANRLQLDETFVARSGVALLSNGGKKRLTTQDLQLLFKQYKRKKYVYYATDDLSKLMEIHLEDDRIEKIEYSAEIFKPHLALCKEDKKNVYLFPNPTLGEVRLHFENYPAGDYVLDIYNIIGKRLSSIDVSLDVDEREVFVILPDLKKGTYIYSIKNATGDRLVSRRLSIITF